MKLTRIPTWFTQMSLAFLVVGIVGSTPHSFAAEEPPFNSSTFQDVPWGSDLTIDPRFKCKYQPMSRAHYCTDKNQTMEFLNTPVWSFEFSLNFDKQFDQVYIRVNDREGFDRLRSALVEKLGEDYYGNFAGQDENYRWSLEQLDILLTDNLYQFGDKDDKYTKYQQYLRIQHREYFQPRSYQVSTSGCTNRDCNLNKDQNCDQLDMAILESALGQCDQPGHYFYNSDADLDKDICITDKDKAILQKSMGQAGYVCEPNPLGIIGF